MVICGNKCDLQGREVAREEGEQLAAELGVPYMETSAKDNLNVEETFGSLASRVSLEIFVGNPGRCRGCPYLRRRYHAVVDQVRSSGEVE